MLRTLILASLCVGCALSDPTAAPDAAARHAVGDDAELRAQIERDRQATEYLGRAAQALGHGRPEDCLRELGFAAQLAERDATWYLLAAMARLDQGRPAQAVDDLQNVVRLDPADAGSWALLGRARFELRQLEGARRALERAVSLAPDEAQHHGSLGLVCLEAQRWEQAHEAFSAALERDPELLVAHQGLARLYSLAGLPDAAVVALQHAVDASPEDPGLRVELGHALRDDGMPDLALAAYEAADALDPDNPWILANLGAVCQELHAFEAAREHLEAARRGFAEMDRVEASVEHSLGQVLLALARPRHALEALENAYAERPELPGLAEELGLLLADRGDDRGARDVLNPAADRDALSRTALYELCLLEERAGRVQRAHALATKLLVVPRDDPGAALLAARLRLRSGLPRVRDTAGAARELEALTREHLAAHPDSWMLLAEARVASGQLSGAVEAVDEALALLGGEGPEARRARATREQLLRRLASAAAVDVVEER